MMPAGVRLSGSRGVLDRLAACTIDGVESRRRPFAGPIDSDYGLLIDMA